MIETMVLITILLIVGLVALPAILKPIAVAIYIAMLVVLLTGMLKVYK